MALNKDEHLHYETVKPVLINTLNALMRNPVFDGFNLVGGTNLSLRFGHRCSDDIDLFTDAEYGSIDFAKLEIELARLFPYFDNPDRSGIVGFGRMYYVGLNEENAVKLDLMYTDRFISNPEVIDGIRFEPIDQIAAMKMEAINPKCLLGKDWDDIKLHIIRQVELYSHN